MNLHNQMLPQLEYLNPSNLKPFGYTTPPLTDILTVHLLLSPSQLFFFLSKRNFFIFRKEKKQGLNRSRACRKNATRDPSNQEGKAPTTNTKNQNNRNAHTKTPKQNQTINRTIQTIWLHLDKNPTKPNQKWNQHWWSTKLGHKPSDKGNQNSIDSEAPSSKSAYHHLPNK